MYSDKRISRGKLRFIIVDEWEAPFLAKYQDTRPGHAKNCNRLTFEQRKEKASLKKTMLRPQEYKEMTDSKNCNRLTFEQRKEKASLKKTMLRPQEYKEMTDSKNCNHLTFGECKEKASVKKTLICPQEYKKMGGNDKKPGEEWRDLAEEMQQTYYECFSDRECDFIDCHQERKLTLKVGYALFGEPTEDDEHHPYSKDVMKEIKKFTEAIYKIRDSQCVYMALLFVVGQVKSDIISVPVFKVFKQDFTPIFLDHHLRQYCSWEKFLKENRLPKGVFAYPKDGLYQGDMNGKVLLTFLPSPANSLGSKLMIAGDVVTSATSIAAIAVSFSLPPVAPIALAVSSLCGLYSVVKDSVAIHDRRIHKQSISLGDRDARRYWLSTIGCSIGVLSGLGAAGIVHLASRGRNIGLAVRMSVNVVNGSSLAVKGVGVVENFASLIIKTKNKEFSKHDLLNFSMSLLLFTNVLVNTKTAESLIVQVQRDVGNAESKQGLLKMLVRSVKKKFGKNNSSINGDILHGVSNKILKGVGEEKLTEIQVYLTKQVVESSKDAYLEMSEDLKEKIEKLVARYFGSNKDDISSELIRKSEKLAQDMGYLTDDGIIDICRFLIIYKEMRLKEMKKDYVKKKKLKKELLGENFDESLFDKEYGIQCPVNKNEWFQCALDKEIEESNEDIKQKFETSIKEIVAINEDGGMKFYSSLKALNEFCHSFIIDGQELCPREFFRIIRELVSEGACEVVECDNRKIYSDCSIPVHVKVFEDNEGSFFESVSFVSINDTF